MKKLGAQRLGCPVCEETSHQVFFDGPRLPVLANGIYPSRKRALEAPRGKIRLALCPSCGHIFNLAFQPELVTYQHYENSLHFSPRFQRYVLGLADRLIRRYQLRGKRLVEIGCGDGHFLKLLCTRGNNRGWGFDPACRKHARPEEEGTVRILPHTYSSRYRSLQADFYCCRHTLEHLERPRELLQLLREGMDRHRNPFFFFEVPNGLYTFRDLGIWDIIYEHCSYFTPYSFRFLLRSSGYRPLDLRPAYGGQFLTLEASLKDRASARRTPRIARGHLDRLVRQTQAFAESYQRKVREWRKRLQEFSASGQRVVLWGAGSKGISFLNLAGPNGPVEYTVDINPRKEGRFVPVTGQRIVPPRFLAEYRPDVVLLSNSLYRREVAKVLAELSLSSTLVPI